MTTLTGTGRLSWFVVRRDRLRLLLWIGGIVGTVIASAAALPPVYPDQESIEQYTVLFGDNPALVAFAGPGYGFDDPNLGVILVNETQVFGMIGMALMAIFLVNRHTRAEEDVERAEVVRSSVVGRHAPTAAALAVVAAVVVLVSAACAVGFVATGYAVHGSVALAASLAAVGLVFVGITAVAAQIASTGRGTLGLASATLVATFVLRAVGDIGDNALRWLSPMGWAQAVRAFAGEVWWPIVLCLAAAGGLVGVAFWLFSRRDLGSGILATRGGPARGAASLSRPVGLAVRLHRGTVIGWAVGMFVTGLVYGSIGEDIEEMVEENPTFADILAQLEGASVTDAFFATSLLMLALIASGFAISAVLRLRSEEGAGRAEPLLAGPLGRIHWAASHLVVAVVGTVVVIAAGGLGIGVSYAVVAEDAGQVARMTLASLVTVPPALVLTGLTLALFGLAPRAVMVAWAVLAGVVVVGVLGEVLRLPAWTRQLSPFDHAPAVPAEDLRWFPVIVLLALAAALAAAGLAGFRRRDLRTE
ncbi:ABC transporter permease [Actinomarinicola tropica]|uniref:ABC transporter permease n=1 Tax=Actinomarinicola tropica TaxID=2789776 RepID=A0A5Q2RDR6_9ACTN|nr:ABC transporter permease [Actinomarinicola tropica]QGG95028.1 ABC transporter permease [Actinomarinicola tropica]